MGGGWGEERREEEGGGGRVGGKIRWKKKKEEKTISDNKWDGWTVYSVRVAYSSWSLLILLNYWSKICKFIPWFLMLGCNWAYKYTDGFRHRHSLPTICVVQQSFLDYTDGNCSIGLTFLGRLLSLVLLFIHLFLLSLLIIVIHFFFLMFLKQRCHLLLAAYLLGKTRKVNSSISFSFY